MDKRTKKMLLRTLTVLAILGAIIGIVFFSSNFVISGLGFGVTLICYAYGVMFIAKDRPNIH